jgi:hypothetical protein
MLANPRVGAARRDRTRETNSRRRRPGGASPFRSKTNLGLLEARGVIDHEQFLAGELFRSRFQVAQLEPLCAFGPTQPPRQRFVPSLSPGERIESATDYVWSRIVACGGLASLPGSLCWNVVGLEISLHAWAIERSLPNQRVNQHGALRGPDIGPDLARGRYGQPLLAPPRVPMPDGIVAAADMTLPV